MDAMDSPVNLSLLSLAPPQQLPSSGDQLCPWDGDDDLSLHRGEMTFQPSTPLARRISKEDIKSGISSAAAQQIRRNSKELVDMNDMLAQKRYVQMPSVALRSPDSASEGVPSANSATGSSVDLNTTVHAQRNNSGQEASGDEAHGSRTRAELQKALADAEVLQKVDDTIASGRLPDPLQGRTDATSPPEQIPGADPAEHGPRDSSSKSEEEPADAHETGEITSPEDIRDNEEGDAKPLDKCLYVNGSADLDWFDVPSQESSQRIAASAAVAASKKKTHQGASKAHDTSGGALLVEIGKVMPEKKKPILDISLEAWRKENDNVEEAALLAVSSAPSLFGDFVEWRQTKSLRTRPAIVSPTLSSKLIDSPEVRTATLSALPRAKRSAKRVPLCATMASAGGLRSSWPDGRANTTAVATPAAAPTPAAQTAARAESEAGLRIILEQKMKRRRENRRLQRERLQTGKAAWDPAEIQIRNPEQKQLANAVAVCSPKGGPQTIQLKMRF